MGWPHGMAAQDQSPLGDVPQVFTCDAVGQAVDQAGVQGMTPRKRPWRIAGSEPVFILLPHALETGLHGRGQSPTAQCLVCGGSG